MNRQGKLRRSDSFSFLIILIFMLLFFLGKISAMASRWVMTQVCMNCIGPIYCQYSMLTHIHSWIIELQVDPGLVFPWSCPAPSKMQSYREPDLNNFLSNWEYWCRAKWFLWVISYYIFTFKSRILRIQFSQFGRKLFTPGTQ